METLNTNLNNFLNGHSTENGRVKLALDDIKKSGLTLKTIEAAGIQLFNGKSDLLKQRLGFSSLKGNNILSVAVLMEIPYRDADGNIIKYEYRLYPETDERKYLHPLHSPSVPYILSDVWAIKDKANKPLYITEGVKKVLKITQHGRPCIGLSGVWGFRVGKNDEAAGLLSEELASFTWNGRTVYLAFDADLWINPQVRKALYELALHLTARSALVYICTWKGEKGIDDYLATKVEPEKEISEIEAKAKPLMSFITPEHRGDVLYALSKTINNMDELTKESIVTAISKKLNLKPKSIYKTVLKEVAAEDAGFTEDEKEQAAKLLRSPNLIELFLDLCHTQYVGRDKTLILIKLATMTRHLKRGLSVVLIGKSSVGKSALVDTVLMTVDQEVVENFSRTSAQYLLYRTKPLDHKIVTFYEFNGADSSSAIIRTALTEGELHLGTVQKDASGSLCATEIRKETQGLVILSTYTGSKIDTELSTRVLLQEITHDEELAREVYRRKAVSVDNNVDRFRVWQAADKLLEARPVVIPYLSKLAEVFPTKEERFHRDYDKTIMLIKASALLHQYQREQDENGAIIAREEDYRLVYSLGDAFTQSLLAVSESVLNMLDEAKKLGKPTRAKLKETINVSEATIKRYVDQAKGAQLIETEGRGQTQIITVIDTPVSFTVLPDPEKIFINHDEPLSQAEKSVDKSGDDRAHPPMSQNDPNERCEVANEEDSSNGSASSNDAELKNNHISSQSILNSLVGQEKDHKILFHCDKIPVPTGTCQSFIFKLYPPTMELEPFCKSSGIWCHIVNTNRKLQQ